MSKEPFKGDWGVRKKTAMGQQVGALKLYEDLKETACVHVEERELIGWCRVFPLLFPKEKDFNKFLEKQAIPAFLRVGRQRWYRDIITDLALALSAKGKTEESEDVGKLLEKDSE